MNTFDEFKERDELRGDEWLFGTVTTDLGLVPLETRLSYAPRGVLQFNNVMDTSGCASRAPLNILETKFTYFYQTTMHPNLKEWLEVQGYVEGGKVVFNDAFIEILSGTTRHGNSLKAPLEAIRKNGLIPRSAIPLEAGMTWEQYMDPARVTQEHRGQGAEFLRRFSINYEQVLSSQFLVALKDDLLDVAGHAWPNPVNGVYPRNEGSHNHAFANATPEIDALDTYEPFVKRLAKDYSFFAWGYRIAITGQNPMPNQQVAVFETLKRFNMLHLFHRFLELLLGPKPVPVAPVAPPAPPLPPKQETAAERLAEAAIAMLGRDASPRNRAPQELSCAESVVNITNGVWANTFPDDVVDTYVLDQKLKKSPRFKPTLDLQPGYIVIYPRYGAKNGHVMICTRPNVLAGNNSDTGLFEETHTRESARADFLIKRGLPAGRIYKPVDITS